MAGADDIVHAQTHALLSYWQRLRGDRPAPYRSEVDPRSMDCDIGNVFIIEVLDDGTERFRVAGSQVINTFGMELRGVPVRAILDVSAREGVATLISETLATAAIGYARLCPGVGGSELWEMLLLPLRSDSGKLDRVLGMLFQLAGGQNLEQLVPLRMALERMSIQPVTSAGDGGDGALSEAGFAESGEAFSGLPAPSGPIRLTAIEGGLAAPGATRRRQRPALRIVEDD